MSSHLRLDWCSHAAAKYAVEHWHYSRSLPPFPRVHVGVWEESGFIGSIIFSRGATPQMFVPYGLEQTDACELTRVALGDHRTAVSKMLSIATRMLVSRCPGVRLIVSHADPYRGHHGGIYQAAGWIYTGCTSSSKMYRDPRGRLWHGRMISPTGYKRVFGRYRPVIKPNSCTEVAMPGKHRYLFPTDKEMRSRVLPIAQEYPKR